MAEFAANNNESASTKLSLFFDTTGLHVYMSFERVELLDASICKRILNQKALDISRNMQTTWEFVESLSSSTEKSVKAS